MGTFLNPGNSGFERIINGIYVDKTGLIGIINHTIGTTSNLSCVSRPRRFGKSYAAQMLCAYYDKTCDSSAFFEKYEIAQDKTYKEHLNKYDVIYLDMTGIIGAADKGDLVSFIIRNVTQELVAAYPELEIQEAFFGTLANMVEITHNKIIMIIDEWDAPIREINNEKSQREYLEFLRSLFKNSGTTAKIFAAAYMTGILPIKKDGSQSAISDFKEYSVLSPGVFAPYAGFTQDEVVGLCQDHQIHFDTVRRWYDGYTLDEIHSVYNPFSVISAIQNRKFKSYWKKTSASEALLTYIDMNQEGLQDDIVKLINGETIEIDTDGFENDFATFRSKDDILTLLVHLGYLAYEERSDSFENFDGAEELSGFVRIPNEEVRLEFKKILRKGKHENC